MTEKGEANILIDANAEGKNLFRRILSRTSHGSVDVAEPAHSNVIRAPLIPLDSFVAREEHSEGRKSATRNVQPQEQGEVYDATSANPAALIAMELVRTIA
ncbi:hypothetical protein AXW67_05545 [Bradyrhizobium neotropicale]|uniref:Uncharacterized protein n=1 Tax=Bradyrhizobium neotropicale TaxID=1497615 RepID=A0A176ZCR5_9BRAD|nr:hypothetical protein AXW67_05545 [Bradyrhizobium neotropicale]